MTAESVASLQKLFDEHLRVRVRLEDLLIEEKELLKRLSVALLAIPAPQRERSIRDFVERAGKNLEAEL